MWSKNAIRSDIRNNSNLGKYSRVSLQRCSVEENENILNKQIDVCERAKPSEVNIIHLANLKGLRAVLQMLTVNYKNNDRMVRKSYLLFDDALELFLSFKDNATESSIKDKETRQKFRDLLCHEKYGLCVYVVLEKYVVLSSDDVNLEGFFDDLIDGVKSEVQFVPLRQELTPDFAKNLLDLTDTEWDRKLLRVVLGAVKTKQELKKLGISSRIAKYTNEVRAAMQERNAIEREAIDIVKKSIRSKICRLENTIEEMRRKLLMKGNTWGKMQLDDLYQDLEDIQSRYTESKCMLDQIDRRILPKNLRNIVRNAINRLINEQRIGLRKKSSGRPVALDEIDEQFIHDCIESKSTAHGRRHDSVMYLNHRVKKKDFLRIANHSRISRGLKPIKSSTTVYNRGRAKNKRNQQAKKHIGLGLFCSKKPPKLEDKENLLTHHQRAFKKNILMKQCHPDNGIGLRSNLFISRDDKAYICPGTGTGSSQTKICFISYRYPFYLV